MRPLLSLSVALLSVVLAVSAQNSPRVIGYYMPQENGLAMDKIDGSKLSHLLYAFANPFEDGTVSLDNIPGPNLANLARLATEQKITDEDSSCKCSGKCLSGYFNQMLLLKRKYPHLKVLLSVGGWGFSKNFSVALSDAQRRDRFIKSSTDLMTTYGFDGIDIDWEFPSIARPDAGSSPNDWPNMLSLVNEYRRYWNSSVKFGNTKELSIAVPATRVTSGRFLTDAVLKELADKTDFLMIMAYEYHHGAARTRHGAALRAASGDNQQEQIENASAGIATYAKIAPKNKLVLGVPLYSMGYTGFDATTSRQGEPRCFGATLGSGGKTIEPQKYKTMIEWTSKGQFGYSAPTVDTKRGTAVTCNGTHFYSFDVPETFKIKADFVKQEGYGGVMLWDLGQDYAPTDSNSGMAAITSALSANTSTILRPQDICIPFSDKFCNWKCPELSRLMTGKVTTGDDKLESPAATPTGTPRTVPTLLDSSKKVNSAPSSYGGIVGCSIVSVLSVIILFV